MSLIRRQLDLDHLFAAEDTLAQRPRWWPWVGVIAMRRLGLIVALGTLLGMFGGLATASTALLCFSAVLSTNRAVRQRLRRG